MNARLTGALADLPLEPAGVPHGRAMIRRAEWAARSFATYDIEAVRRIVKAAAEAGAAHAREFAEAAVAETGFGVVDHKVTKNVGCSTGIWETYGSRDYVTPVVDEQAKIVSIPRPAGVVLGLTPSTNPVATTYFKVLLALMTRNAIVISPHPYAKEVSQRAGEVMAKAAVAAGAPDGCIQVVAEPSVPLINALMTDERVAVIVATGGTPMVRAAYSSANPALGVGPGNVPVLVDETADPVAAARAIVDSKAFDNSILCTNESVVIVTEAAADRFTTALGRAGAHVCSAAEVDAVRATIFDGDHLRTEWIGRSATAIAEAAGIRVPRSTTVLVTPFDLVVPEEMLAHEKLMPVLGLVRVPSAARGIAAAQAVLRITGQGHSAAIHSADPAHVLDFAAAVRVLRVSVNVGNSLGGAGFQTNLPPSMTIGTGYFGNSSLGSNLTPECFVQHTRIAYNADLPAPMTAYSGLDPWRAPEGQVPAYPHASNLPQAVAHTPAPTAAHTAATGAAAAPHDAAEDELREHIRRLVIEELRAMVKD